MPMGMAANQIPGINFSIELFFLKIPSYNLRVFSISASSSCLVRSWLEKILQPLPCPGSLMDHREPCECPLCCGKIP